MSLNGTRWSPIVGSFAVYLVPLVGPHAIWFVGESLLQGLESPGERDPGWLAANVALVLAAQVGVGLLLAWSLRGSLARLLTWIPAIPALTAGLNAAYLVAIPSYFLIEPDTLPELSAWEEHCFVADAGLMPVRTTVNQPASGVHEWWMQRPDGRYTLLRLPDCALADASLPVSGVQAGGRASFTLGFQFSAPGGAATLQRFVPGTSDQSWWLLPAPSAALAAIEQPDVVEAAPILSDAADAIAWVERLERASPPFSSRVVVCALQRASCADRTEIDLTPLGAASYALLGVDTIRNEVVLWRDRQPILVGFDGERRDLRFTPGSVQPQGSTYIRTVDGWVAWDAYREDGPYQLAWTLTAGAGTHRTNNGRGITSAAVDPAGSLLAVSETTNLSIGAARDVVYVIRARDAADVFRVYLPRYSRSQVVFFAGGFFAYSDVTGTHVLKIPA